MEECSFQPDIMLYYWDKLYNATSIWVHPFGHSMQTLGAVLTWDFTSIIFDR